MAYSKTQEIGSHEQAAAQSSGKKRLTGKDLITVGIFTAIYFVTICLVGMLGVIPIFVPLACVLIPLIGGIPLMLFFSKVNKFGMVLILSILQGLLMALGGMGYFSIFTTIIFGFLAELILRSGNYASSRLVVLAYAVQSVWVVGNMLPMFFTRESFFAPYLERYGADYVTMLGSLMPEWSLPLFFVASFVAGLVGGYLGLKIFKKHFVRAGIV